MCAIPRCRDFKPLWLESAYISDVKASNYQQPLEVREFTNQTML